MMMADDLSVKFDEYWKKRALEAEESLKWTRAEVESWMRSASNFHREVIDLREQVEEMRNSYDN